MIRKVSPPKSDAGRKLEIVLELRWTYQLHWTKDETLSKSRGVSNRCITSFESHHSAFGRIEFQNTSGIEREKSLAFDLKTHFVVGSDRTRYEGANPVHTEKTRTYLPKQSELFKALANL